MIHYILRGICRLILNLFFGLEACGKENLPKKGGFILASNHVSYLDPIAVGSASPRKLNYMAKHDLFFNRFFAWVLYKVGAFPVKRATADSWALREAIKRVRKGGGLLLFPEGRRIGLGEESSNVESGVGFLADKLNVPVIPVYVKGTEIAWPKGAKLSSTAKISVTFGKQMNLEKGLSYQEIAQIILDNLRQPSC
jgi:1-acyl-sn-glycerol-3-phosphate acyltransferase